MEKTVGTMNYQTILFKRQRTHTLPSKRENGVAFDGLKGFFILAIITYYYFQHLLLGGFSVS